MTQRQQNATRKYRMRGGRGSSTFPATVPAEEATRQPAMDLTRESILSLLRESKSVLQAEFPLTRLALFGSYARETSTPGKSDVDILVEVEPSIGLRFVTLAERLEDILGARVDLVSRRAIRSSMWEQIQPELIDA